MPPPRRRPATPPSRRPKVAGLHRRPEHEQPEDQPVSEPLPDPEDTEGTPDTAVTSPEQVGAEQVGAEQPEPESEPAPRHRRPTPKRRDAGTTANVLVEQPAPSGRRVQDAEPADAEPVDAEPVDAEPVDAEYTTLEFTDPEPETGTGATAEDDAGRTPSYSLPIALLVLALLLGGLSYWFAQQLSDARVGAGNDALSDVNATKDVVGAAQQSVAGVLSYKFDDMAGSTARAKQFLDGEAVGQYESSMTALQKEIQDQKLQVVVNPVSIGVVRLAGDDARVLVFADQIGVRADNQPSGGPTQFAMDMHRTNGAWKVVKLDFFETR